MKNVGFYGGSTFLELGPSPDMKVFFACLELISSHFQANATVNLLTDRLYRRYLRLDELDPATVLIAQARVILSDISAESIDWKAMGWDPSATKLKLLQPTAADVLDRHLDGARSLMEGSASFEKRFRTYKPVITIITDTPQFYIEKRRSLAEYDALDGEPFWLR